MMKHIDRMSCYSNFRLQTYKTVGKKVEKDMRKVGNELAEIYMNYCDV